MLEVREKREVRLGVLEYRNTVHSAREFVFPSDFGDTGIAFPHTFIGSSL